MNRAQVKELLELRYEFTKESFGEGTVTAWLEAFGDLEYDALKARLHVLSRQGHTRIPAGLLVEGVVSRKNAAHMEQEEPRDEGEYLARNDPRALAAFARGYFEATGREYGARR